MVILSKNSTRRKRFGQESNFDVSGRCGGVEPRSHLYGEHLRQGLLRSFLMRCGFVGEVGGDQESGDFLFLVSEGAEVGDALELLGVRAGFGRAGHRRLGGGWRGC